MGRFYQTSEGRFVDNKMFEAPHQLMAQVLQGRDKAVEEDIAGVKANLDKLQLQGLKQDDPAVNRLISSYQQQIDEQVANIKKNPLDYGKYDYERTQLGRNILKDWTTGEAAKIIENKKAYTDWAARLDDKIKNDKEGLYTPELIANLKAKKMSDFTGTAYNPETGMFQSFKTEDPIALGNIPDILNENVGKYIKADGRETKYDADQGRWVVKTATGWEGVSEQKLKDAAESYLAATPTIPQALKQRRDYAVTGYEDPMSIVKSGIQAFVDANKYGKTTKETGLDSNAAWIQAQGFAHEDMVHDRDNPATEIETITTETHDNIAGNNANAAIAARRQSFISIKENKETLLNSTTNPTIVKQIQQGDFRNVPRTIENLRAVDRIKKDRINLSVQEATKQEFLNTLTPEGRKKAVDDNGNIIMTTEIKEVNGKKIRVYSGYAQDFNVFLQNENKNNQVAHDLSLRQFNLSQKQIDGYNKNFVENLATEVLPIEFAEGTKVLNPKYGKDTTGTQPKFIVLSKKQYTPNELINLGVIQPSKMHEIEGNRSGKKDEKGNSISFTTISPDGKTMNYEIGKALKVTGDYGNDGKLNYYTDMTINGNKTLVKVNNVNIPEVADYARVHADELEAKRFVNNTTAANVKLHKSEQGEIIYYGKDYYDSVTNKRYPKGTILLKGKGNPIVVNANSPDGLKVLSEALKQ